MVLEQRLTEATEIAGAAQRETKRLKNALEEKRRTETGVEENRPQEGPLLSSQGGTSHHNRDTLKLSPTTVHSAAADAAVGEHETTLVDRHAAQEEIATTNIAIAAERVAETGRALEEAKAACQAAKAESEIVSRQLDCARATEAAEAEEKRSANDRIVELERAIEDARQEQERTRELASTRLDRLRSTFEQEERENAGKV